MIRKRTISAVGQNLRVAIAPDVHPPHQSDQILRSPSERQDRKRGVALPSVTMHTLDLFKSLLYLCNRCHHHGCLLEVVFDEITAALFRFFLLTQLLTQEIVPKFKRSAECGNGRN
jgi:hypothetical protein